MAAGFRFEPDEAGIAELTTGDGVNPLLDEAAAEAAKSMERNAKRFDSDDFFDFPTSIKTIKARDGVAYVGSDSPGWHLQEYGTARLSPRAVIRRGIRAVKHIRFEEH